VSEAERLLDAALTHYRVVLTRRPDDALYNATYAFHLCSSVRDTTALLDITSPVFKGFWCVGACY
jgi:hypothetical protein